MSDLIIFNGKEETVNNQFLSLLKKNHLSFILVETIEDLIISLKETSFKGIHLYLGEVFPDYLLSTLTKSKISSHNRNLSLTVQFSHYYKAEFKRALLAGAKWIFVDPLNPNELYNGVKGSIENFIPPIKTKDFQKNITPIPCKVSIFGRIGKIHKDPLGDLHIESNINLEPGDKIKIESSFKRNTEQDQSVYVKNKVEEDIYYNYDYSYTLTSSPFYEETYNKKLKEEGEKRIKKWIEKYKDDFAIPKTKILFISENPINELENFFEKKIFSLYRVSPLDLNEMILKKINPKIIYHEKEANPSTTLLDDWINQTKEPKLLLTGYQKEEKNTIHLPQSHPKEFSQKLTKISEDFLRERVSSSLEHFFYLNRKSYSSRCSLDFVGFLIDATSYYTLLLSPHSVSLGTIIQLEGKTNVEEENFEIFVKVLYVEKSENNLQFNIYGQILPISNKKQSVLGPPTPSSPPLFSKDWMEHYEQGRVRGAKEINLKSRLLILNKFMLTLFLFSVLFITILSLIKSLFK
jgi:hypothetical protein